MVSRNDLGPALTKGDNVIRGEVVVATVTNRLQHSPLVVNDILRSGEHLNDKRLVQNELGDIGHLGGGLAHREKGVGFVYLLYSSANCSALALPLAMRSASAFLKACSCSALTESGRLNSAVSNRC